MLVNHYTRPSIGIYRFQLPLQRHFVGSSFHCNAISSVPASIATPFRRFQLPLQRLQAGHIHCPAILSCISTVLPSSWPYRIEPWQLSITGPIGCIQSAQQLLNSDIYEETTDSIPVHWETYPPAICHHLTPTQRKLQKRHPNISTSIYGLVPIPSRRSILCP